jgi:hypothetical protein
MCRTYFNCQIIRTLSYKCVVLCVLGSRLRLQVQERALRGLGAAMHAPIATLSRHRSTPSHVESEMARLTITQVRRPSALRAHLYKCSASCA